MLDDKSPQTPPVESGEEVDAAEVERGGGEEEVARLGEEPVRVLASPGVVGRVQLVERGVEEVEELAGRAAQHVLEGPRAEVSSRHDSGEFATTRLVEEEKRTLEERVEEEREEFPVLGEDELAGGGAGAALRAVLGEKVLDGGLEVIAQLGEREGVALHGGGAGERHGDGGAVDALEEAGEGVGGLVLLVEHADAATALVVGEGGVKERRKGVSGVASRQWDVCVLWCQWEFKSSYQSIHGSSVNSSVSISLSISLSIFLYLYQYPYQYPYLHQYLYQYQQPYQYPYQYPYLHPYQ